MAYSVTIKTNPTGAKIFLGGSNFGTTPKKLTNLDGNYSMVLKKSGYEDYTAYALSPSDARKTKTFTLTSTTPPSEPTPETYSVTIRTNPSGATILLGSSNYGTTPKTLTGLSGNYSMILRKSDYEDYSSYALSPSDSGKTLTFNLIELPPPEPPEFPKDITRGAYTITVDNATQEVQAKEFLGIEPPGDDLDTWLSRRDLAGLTEWKNYWTDIFSSVGMSYWISFVEDKFEEYKSQLQQRVETVIQGLTRTGIRAVPLNTEELIELFYTLYNPGELAKGGIAETQK